MRCPECNSTDLGDSSYKANTRVCLDCDHEWGKATAYCHCGRWKADCNKECIKCASSFGRKITRFKNTLLTTFEKTR